jgi:hypothetical protein
LVLPPWGRRNQIKELLESAFRPQLELNLALPYLAPGVQPHGRRAPASKDEK